MNHKHNWKIVDYDDADHGIVHVECDCGEWAKATTELHYKNFYSDPKCARGYDDLLYLPELDEDVDELIELDAKALGIKLEERMNEPMPFRKMRKC